MHGELGTELKSFKDLIAEKDKAPYDVKKQEEITKENEKLLTQIQKDQDEIQKLRE